MTEQNDDKNALEKRLDSIGWGLFLIMIGGIWITPEEMIPDGTWLIGTGLIILVLIFVRYVRRIKISGFWLVIGIIALGSGINELYGFEVPVFPVLLILFGAIIILKPLLKEKKQ